MKKIKSALAIILMLSLSINTFGAQVSDNDGSAFITKAEFDSLKSTFQSQIDQYNQSIDSKIDGAIAAYLSGILISSSTKREIKNWDNLNDKKIVFNTKADHIEYKYSPLQFNVIYNYMAAGNDTSGTPVAGPAYINDWHSTLTDPEFRGNKLYIEDPINKKNSTTTWLAQWKGYYNNCYDRWDAMQVGNGARTWGDISMNYLTNATMVCFYNCEFLRNAHGKSFSPNLGFRHCNSVAGGYGGIGTNVFNFGFFGTIAHNVDYEKEEKEFYFTLQDFAFDTFSNYEYSYVFGYTGNQPFKKNSPRTTTLDVGGLNKFFWHLSGTLPSNGWGPVTSDEGPKNYDKIAGWGMQYFRSTLNPSMTAAQTIDYGIQKDEKYLPINLERLISRGGGGATVNTDYVLPIVGFEDDKIKSWGAIFHEAYDDIVKYTTLTTNTIVTDKNDKKHLTVLAGVPLFEIKKDEKVTYKLVFDDNTKNYFVWFKLAPFVGDYPSATDVWKGHPENETGLYENVQGLTKVTGKHCYKVTNGVGEFTIENVPNDCLLYIKFCRDSIEPETAKMAKLIPQQYATCVQTN